MRFCSSTPSEETYSGSRGTYSGSEETYSGPDDSSSLTGSLFEALITFVMIMSDSSSLELSENLRLREGVLKRGQQKITATCTKENQTQLWNYFKMY